MPTTITGDPDFSLTDAITPNAVVPTPGDLAAAGVVRTALERTLDYVSSIAQDAYNKQAFGVGKIEAVGGVAALQARTGMTDGSVVMLLDPSCVGGAAQRLSGFGLFVFFTGATWPQTSVPGIADAWLVIQPTDNSGRWLNVIVGVGWELGSGSDPVFMPRTVDRLHTFYNEGTGGTTTAIIGLGSGAYTPTALTLAAGAKVGAELFVDFDFSLSSPSMSTGINARIEVSIGGGAWTPLLPSVRFLGGNAATGANDVGMSVHLQARLLATTNNTYDFRVTILADAAATVNVGQPWTARALVHDA